MFGEAEKGDFRTAYFCRSLSELVDHLGHPPQGSTGLHYAVQTLLFRHRLVFFRVEEEGFSREDYLLGLEFLERQQLIADLSAICLPGVGDHEIIEASSPLCSQYNSLLITSEPDLYDYLTGTLHPKQG